jgi:hypothetical protein
MFAIGLVSWMLVGCDGQTKTELNQTLSLSDQYASVSLGAANTIHATVDLGSTPKDLYAVLANGNDTNESSLKTSVDAKRIGSSATREEKVLTPLRISDRMKRIREFGAKVHHYPHTDTQRSMRTLKRNAKSVGDEKTFYLDQSSSGATTDAILVKIVQNVGTAFGNKTLNIWVSKNSYGSTCTKSKCVTDAMIDDLADQFLQPGSDNDIYDWVTNIFGEEWGSNAQDHESDLIAATDEITIMLTDIDKDNSPNGGVIGYFYAKDNYKQSVLSGSNETIMFYIDSVMFANTDTSTTNWQKEIYATLAHEFQHMIHFYQKAVLYDATTDVWINEMLSETTEDLVATKINHTGPRGVDPTDGSAGSAKNQLGRYPLFNRYNTRSLSRWSNQLNDYSKVSAFGTFLVRNYGGAKVLHDILHTAKSHADAVEAATGKSMRTLLSQWGTAILLSDRVRTAAQDHTTYNTGDFINNTYSNSTYRLGSINLYNYVLKDGFGNTIQEGPRIYTDDGTVQPHGIYLYKIGESLSGTVRIDFENLNGQTEVTLVTK